MNRKNWKFFVGIGFLLVIAGIVVYPNDPIIGILAIILGIYNVVKGFRLYRGIQPLIIRKQQEREKQLKNEVQNKIDDANKNRNANKNK